MTNHAKVGFVSESQILIKMQNLKQLVVRRRFLSSRGGKSDGDGDDEADVNAYTSEFTEL